MVLFRWQQLTSIDWLQNVKVFSKKSIVLRLAFSDVPEISKCCHEVLKVIALTDCVIARQSSESWKKMLRPRK